MPEVLSQIGVFKALEENKIPIDIIVGTSMGSIIGGLYMLPVIALKQIDSIAENTDWNEILAPWETDRKELFVDQKVTEDKAIFTLRLKGFNTYNPDVN